MCGIFGAVLNTHSLQQAAIRKLADCLFKLSESRGKESAGLAIHSAESIQVFKLPFAASKMIKSKDYTSFFNNAVKKRINQKGNIAFIGHSRLVTNGSQENQENNQPVIKDRIVGIHNGIIVNDKALWQQYPEIKRLYQVDTEVLLSLIRHFYSKTGSLIAGYQRAFQEIKGTASTAAFFEDLNLLALCTNNGSLYTIRNDAQGVLAFASEAFILKQLANRSDLKPFLEGAEIQQIVPGTGLMINLQDLCITPFDLIDTPLSIETPELTAAAKNRVEVAAQPDIHYSGSSVVDIATFIPENITNRFSIDPKPIASLRRCTRCLLPETMPFIQYDQDGVCNYCHRYKKQQPMGREALEEALKKYRRTDGRPDCLVTFSGGRDSSYSLHYIKKELDMHPVAYSYDWGMITDLARRNQARMCGKLGIEHILVSADIKQKRAYIRKNVLAWLKKPHLGTVPLFMAGDKQYFYYANKLQQQVGVDLIMIGSNPMEETLFKFGFSGVKPGSNGKSLTYQFKLAAFYGKEYLLNPAYINDSLLDTVGAFASYYLIPRNYLLFYRYILWDEKEISSTLINEYDWETAKDTKSTWRIGDGTASFYNYIYYCVAGFSENDTFYSNLIREGVIDREKALEIVNRDNQPRFESIKWYCDTIGIDFEPALSRIQSIPKLYKVLSS